MDTRTFWHVAHPRWSPGQPLLSRNDLLTVGLEIPWLWDEAEEGTDCDRVSLFVDDEQGRQYRDWLTEDRPDYWLLRVDLPADLDVGRAEWEPMFAAVAEVAAEYITVIRAAA